MHEALRDLYQLDDTAAMISRDDFPGISQSHWDAAVRYLHSHGGYRPEMLTADDFARLIADTHSALMQAVGHGLTHSVPPELTAALTRNTFVFSGFKTHAALAEASALLAEADGSLKSFERFRQDVTAIHETYNVRYLRAEYTFAEASAHMALKWHDWTQTGRRTMLQFRTASDDRVRDSHRLLHNTTLPIDDPFWDSYIPPLGWRCRCTAVRVPADTRPSDPTVAASIGQAATDSPKLRIFRFNPGKTLNIFPPKHPYLPKGCGNCNQSLLAFDKRRPQCQACKAIARLCTQGSMAKQGLTAKAKEAIYSKPLTEQYTRIPTDNGTLLQHDLVCRTEDDYPFVLEAAKAFASRYELCKMNPRVNRKAAEARRKIFPDIDGHANPDLWVKGLGYVDIKSPFNRLNCVSNANHASHRQHATACITDHRTEITREQANRMTESIWKEKHYTHDRVFWMIDGDLIEIQRPGY